MSRSAQDRVAPDGRIVAPSVRGAWMGNRGQLHDGAGATAVRRRHQNKTWLICELGLMGRRVTHRMPGRHTPLFFVDEASAFAAGHRPCAECRRASYNDYRTKWAWTHPGRAPYAAEIDADLHVQRLTDAEGRRALIEIPWSFVPAGAFVMLDDRAAVVLDSSVAPYDADRGCYLPAVERPTSGFARALTPPSTLAVLQRGYPVQIDPSATG